MSLPACFLSGGSGASRAGPGQSGEMACLVVLSLLPHKPPLAVPPLELTQARRKKEEEKSAIKHVQVASHLFSSGFLLSDVSSFSFTSLLSLHLLASLSHSPQHFSVPTKWHFPPFPQS